MEKFKICRICLVEDVRMFVVVNKNLHELYEKLTDVPFVTEDRRPMLTCFYCCTKLKQCYRFLRKCLEAEELFAEMLNEEYEGNPKINLEYLEVFHWFIISPMEQISISEGNQTDSVTIKDEFPAASESREEIVDPVEEHQTDDNSYPDVEESPAVHAETDSENIPSTEIKSEGEDGRESLESELDNVDNSYPDVAESPAVHAEADSENVPSTEIKTEAEDEQESIGVLIAEKPKRDTQIPKPGDTISIEQKKKGNGRKVSCVSKTIKENQNRTSKRTTKFKGSFTKLKRGVNSRVNNTALSTSSANNINETDNKSKMTGKGIDGDDSYNRRERVKEKRFKCDICQCSFSKKNDLTRHNRTHPREKRFKCEICQRSFSQKSNLTIHNRIHTGEKTYSCDICQRGFIHKHSLTGHMRIYHRNGGKSFECDFCHRNFKLKNTLSRHLRTHTGEKPYKCEICQRGFSENRNLNAHIRVHTGEKPFKCDICHRSFNERGNLNVHNRIHTGERPFKCDICNCRFRFRHHFTQHIQMHTGVKPYKCDICQTSFFEKRHLVKHIQWHASEKPFKCKICNRCFSDKSKLTVHIRVHTGDKSFECDFCQRDFKLKHSLCRHMLTHTYR